MAKQINNQLPKVGPMAKVKPGPTAGNGAAKPYLLHGKLWLLLCIVSFLVYANTLGNGFVLDDHTVITDNTIVTKGMAGIPDLLTTPYHHGWSATPADNLYRPISLILFATEYALFGANPMPYHLGSILLFMGCVLVLFLVLNKLFDYKRTLVVFVASLLFALHPIHTEVVANIKSCDELLCFLFAFASLYIFLKYADSGKTTQLLAGGALFLLSVLSKETSFIFMFIIPFIFFLHRNEDKKRSFIITGSMVLTALVCLGIRQMVFSKHLSQGIINYDLIENALANATLSFESRLATAVLIAGHYIKLLFIPYPLICDYSFNSIPYTHFADLKVLLSIAVYGFLIFFSLFRLSKDRKDPYSFGIIFFLCGIALVTNVLFLIGTTMGERLLFFPSVGFCLCIALLTEQITSKAHSIISLKNTKAVGVITVMCLAYTVITIGRNADWVDNDTLYTTDVAKAPNDARLNQYVGDALLASLGKENVPPATQQQMAQQAVTYLQQAVAVYPDYVNAHADLGKAFAIVNMPDSAEAHNQLALALDPNILVVLYNIARMRFLNNNFPDAIAYNLRALKIEPDNPYTYANIAVGYSKMNKYDSTIYYAKIAAIKQPEYKVAYGLQADAYKALGIMDSFVKYDQIARSR